MKRNNWLNLALRLIVSLAIASVVILIMGNSPIEVFYQILKGAFGNKFNFGGMLEKFVPLTLTAVAFAVSTKVGASNVGVEGELYFGAITAAYLGHKIVGLAGPIHIGVCFAAAMLVGALWALIPGALKAYLGVNEVCTTIMLNYVAKALCSYLVNYPLSAGVGVAQTPVIEDTARLSRILPPSRANTGLFIALGVVLLMYLFFNHTTSGYRLRCIGNNTAFSQYVGFNHRRGLVVGMMISGAIGGLAGSIEVMGLYGYFLDNFSINMAFDGMLVSLISKNKLTVIPFAALMIASMKAGALSLNRYTDMTKAFVDTILALFIVLSCIEHLFDVRLLPGKKRRSSVSEK